MFTFSLLLNSSIAVSTEIWLDYSFWFPLSLAGWLARSETIPFLLLLKVTSNKPSVILFTVPPYRMTVCPGLDQLLQLLLAARPPMRKIREKSVCRNESKSLSSEQLVRRLDMVTFPNNFRAYPRKPLIKLCVSCETNTFLTIPIKQTVF